ncbi:MAG: sn-glycerol-1-phosphate dehydrogenase, partial [Clostridiales bacterium]|nr:sn-glycerol-1-phosphate dehydrogenase [Clostridiales bacterium]
WRMSNILGIEREEPYCDNVAGLVKNAIEKCVEAAPGLKSRSEEATRAIMEGLILAGLCIGLAGHSRPASGSEHQISHYIEMKFLENNIDTKWLHGNKVGVGTLMIIEAYDFLFKKSLNQIKSSGKYLEFDIEKWRERIKDGFGNLAGEIFRLKEQDILVEKVDRQERMDLIDENWTTLKQDCYEVLPSPDVLREILKDTGAIYSPKQLDIDKELFRETMTLCKEVQHRYGIMQLLEDLGMLEEAVDYIVDKYYGV